jgi:hypothetical protein
MFTRQSVRRRGGPAVGWLIVALAFVSLIPLAAQLPESRPADLPNGPAKPGFDISRFSSAGNGWFDMFYVKDTELLRDVLKAGKVAEDTRLLVTDTAGGKLALLTDQWPSITSRRALPAARIGWRRFDRCVTPGPVWSRRSTARCITSTTSVCTTRCS